MCCKRRKFRKSVYVYRTDDPEIAEVIRRGAIGELNPRQQVGGEYFFCSDCRTKLYKGKCPAMHHRNNLELVNLEGREELKLSRLENQLIARLLIFQFIVKLPKSRWAGTKNKIVAVPVNEQDVTNTLESLP